MGESGEVGADTSSEMIKGASAHPLSGEPAEPVYTPGLEYDAHEKLPDGFSALLNMPDGRAITPSQDVQESFEDFLKRMEVDGQELMTDEEKEEIFGTAIAQMYDVAKERGISLPDCLISRIHVLDVRAFESLYKKNSNTRPPSVVFGVTYPNRQTALNYWDIKGISSSTNPRLDMTRLVRAFGIHELWHSVQQKDTYERTPADGGVWYGGNPPLLRRSGLRIKGITWNNMSEGLDLMNEGYVQYLTDTTLKKATEEDVYSPYEEQTGIVHALVDDIGEKPFVCAACTRDGICELSDALDETYGKDALPQIAVRMKADGDWRAEGYQYSTITREYLAKNRKLK